MRPRTFAALAALVAVGAAVRAHRSDMRRMRESAIASRNFLAGVIHERDRRDAELEAEGLPGLPTLAELRDARGWISGPMPAVPLEDSMAWWERTWPDPDRLDDEGGGG
jgi:hypothetical protein